MNGSVRRRGNGDWEYRVDVGQDPLTGRRRRLGKSGFKTKKEADAALRAALNANDRGRSVRSSRRNVRDFLNEWHAAVRSSLRPTTWVSYRSYLDAYVIPVIGDSRLQDLTPVRLNLFYSHLLEKGRVKQAGGLAPKTVQNVHRMLYRDRLAGVDPTGAPHPPRRAETDLLQQLTGTQHVGHVPSPPPSTVTASEGYITSAAPCT